MVWAGFKFEDKRLFRSHLLEDKVCINCNWINEKLAIFLPNPKILILKIGGNDFCLHIF